MKRCDKAKFPTIEDCRIGAQKRLPKFLFDFLDGGTDQEMSVARNRHAFDRITILHEVGRAKEHPSLKSTILGQNWKIPLGVCPCGYVDLLDPGTELAAAQAAEENGAPFIASLSTISPLEELKEVAPTSLWLQVLRTKDETLCFDIVQRAKVCGVKTLVVTMDIPFTSKRVRDLRNGFTLPLQPSVKLAVDLLAHPRWLVATLRRPNPKPGNFLEHLPPGVTTTSAAVALEEQGEWVTTWEDLKMFRDLWSGNLIVKGILNPKDAEIALELGADGVIVSNHGGRQFDAAPPTIEQLPPVFEAVGDRIPVMIDSGIRSGLDVLRALALGASMVFSGRSFYFACGAMGKTGAAHAFELLTEELQITMRQAGFRSLEEARNCDPERIQRK